MLTIACSANVTSFEWFNGVKHVDNIPGHIAGQGTKTLTITNIGTDDHGNYTCVVGSPTAGLSATTDIIKVCVIDNPPQFTDPIAFPPAIVGGTFSYKLAEHINTADNLTPVSYSATPLPNGIGINKTTGELSGRPDVALAPNTSKIYPVVIKATNAKGSSTRTINLTVAALPAGTVGTFAGFVPRDPDLNANLGGRLTLTTASGGTYSGTLIDGVTTRKLSGKLTAVPASTLVTGSVTFTRTNSTTLTLNFTIDSASSTLILTTLTDGPHTVSINGWRNVVPTTAYQGLHNFGITLASPNSAMPQGTGYGSFKVSPTGTLTAAGRLADGIAYSTATFIGPGGQVLIHQASSSTDVVLGSLTVTPGVASDFSDYTLAGTLSWSRVQQSTKTRLYRDKFGPIDLTVKGGRYVEPTGSQAFLGMTYTVGVTTSNGALVFTAADFGTVGPPNVTLLVKPTGTPSALAPNPRGTTLKVTNSSGAFSGTFSMIDANPLAPSTNIPRFPIAFQGLVYRDGASLVAGGYFLLNNLPRNAGETSSTTATVSGKVVLNKAP